MREPKLAESGRHTCDGCGKTWNADKLLDFEDLMQRIEPGGMVPSGECPSCGALCYPKAKKRDPIIVTISGGAVQDVDNPSGYPLEIHDYDIEEEDAIASDCPKDAEGDYYQVMKW